MNPGRVAATTGAQLKMMFRRRIVLFWSLLFPIILMTLLGLLFGRSVGAGTVTVLDQAHTPGAAAMISALRHTSGVTVKPDSESVAAARKQVQDGNRDAVLVLTKTGSGETSATLYYSNASATQAGIMKGIVFGIASRVSVAATGDPPAISFTQRSVDSSALDYVDFLMPGILALSIMISAVIGLATVLVDWRKRGILRRLKLTPMPLSEFLTSRILASLSLALLQVVVLIAFGLPVSDQASSSIIDLTQVVAPFLGRDVLALKDLREGQDTAERIVDLVRDTAREAADRRQLLGAGQLAGHLPLLGDVVVAAHG